MKALQKLFRKPSASELAIRELDDARRLLLESQRYRDYYTKMCEFHETRIRSLQSAPKAVDWKEMPDQD